MESVCDKSQRPSKLQHQRGSTIHSAMKHTVLPIADSHCNELPRELGTFFARASVLATLLRAQLELPLFYPLNSRGATAADAIRLSKINSSEIDDATLTYGLGQVAPAIMALTKIASIIQIGVALKYFTARSNFVKQCNPVKRPCASALYNIRNNANSQDRRRDVTTAKTTFLHLKRKQQWNFRQPNQDSQTGHLRWQYPRPPPKLTPKAR